MMMLKFLKDGFGRLEGLCKEFLWGKNDQGKPRQPLVAWEMITQHTIVGGLEIQCFKQQAIKVAKTQKYDQITSWKLV